MRRSIASLILLLYIVIYVMIAATIGGMLAKSPVWIQIPYFAIAGVLWAFPLKPLMTWAYADPKERNSNSDQDF